MLEKNKQMQKYLSTNGIKATPKYIETGSLRGCWRIYSRGKQMMNGSNMLFWTQELAEKLNALGFSDFNRKPLDEYSGNGGRFQIFAKFNK